MPDEPVRDWIVFRLDPDKGHMRVTMYYRQDSTWSAVLNDAELMDMEDAAAVARMYPGAIPKQIVLPE